MKPLFQTFCRHNKTFLRHMCATISSQFFLVFLQIVSALVMANMVEMITDTNTKNRESSYLMAAALFLGLFSACLDGIYRRWKSNRKEDYLAETRGDILNALLHGEYAKVSRYETGDLLERVQGSAAKLVELFVDNLASFSFQMVRLVVVGGVLLWLEPLLTVLLLAVYPVVMYVQNKLAGLLGKWQEAMVQKSAEENSLSQVLLQQKEAIQVYGMEEEMERRYEAATAESRQAFLGFLKAYAAQMPFGAFFTLFPQLLLYGSAGFLVFYGNMQVEEFLVYSLLAEPILQILYGIFQSLQNLKQQQVSAKRVLELWEIPEESFGNGTFSLEPMGSVDSVTSINSVDSTNSMDSADLVDSMESAVLVEFSHVWFRYQEDLDYVLKDVSFQIKRGEKVYLFGESGQGKSTICKLLTGLYHAEKGEIRVGGKNIEEWEINALRASMMNVTQQVYLLPDTVKQNLTAFGIEIKKTETWENLIHTLRLEKLIEDDRTISQNGLQLSGGEKKRLALLRAFMLPCPLLLLDEPYAGLDQETRQAVEELLWGREGTVLVISHEPLNSSGAEWNLSNPRNLSNPVKKLRLVKGGIVSEA